MLGSSVILYSKEETRQLLMPEDTETIQVFSPPPRNATSTNGMRAVASAPALGITPNPQSQSHFVKVLCKQLGYSLVEEMELTVHVAVMSAAGLTRAEIVRRLDSSDLEIRMALVRLQRIAENWK